MRISQVRLNKEVLRLFELQISRFGMTETGGVLMGYVEDETIFVEKASDPGPKALHENVNFQADPDYTDMFIDMEYANSNGKNRYLGEWHTHPQIVPEPSELDLISLAEIAETSDDFALLLIIGAIHYSTNEFSSHSISILKKKNQDDFHLLNFKY